MKQMASLLRSYGMKDKQIALLKRWDRVHVIRDLSTKAASDGMGDELGERFARGEKIRLSDQRQTYQLRIQEIWRRQIAALSATTEGGGDGDASSPDDPADANMADGGGSSTGKGKDDDAKTNDSNSSDEDDDFLAEMEVEMSNTGEANRLMTAQLRENNKLDARELNRDARDFAALQRQREEERAMMLEQQGFDRSGGGSGAAGSKKRLKVIRRKITKVRCCVKSHKQYFVLSPS